MKTVVITTVWEAQVEVEVEDDFTIPSTLNEFPQDVLEQMTTDGASLVDWN